MNQKPAPRTALIVAASENNVIGIDNDLPWRLSADLRRFKSLTMGHSIIMGRKTFESIGRLLPGRETVIITRNRDYQFAGAQIVHSIDEAIEHCHGHALSFFTGGADVYRSALAYVDEIFLTRVHVEIAGDTFLPEINWSAFDLIASESFDADDKNEHPFTLLHYRRNV